MRMRIDSGHIGLRIQVQIVTYNSANVIRACLDAVTSQTARIERVVVIDNGSEDDTLGIVEAGRVDVVPIGRNIGYASGHNVGFRMAIDRGMDVVITLNPDVVLDSEYVAKAIESLCADASIGGVTGKLCRPDGRLDSAGLEMWSFYHVRDRGSEQKDDNRWSGMCEVWGVCGAAAVYRVAMLKDVMLRSGDILDSVFFLYKEDVDLCWRARQFAWRFLYNPDAVAIHGRGWKRGTRPSVIATGHSFANQIALLVRHVPTFSFGVVMAICVELGRYMMLALKRPNVWWFATRLIVAHWRYHWRVRSELVARKGAGRESHDFCYPSHI
ncbi:glycosyltransferase family 2 protein [Alicyclobacillus hesperidum]|uniref:glycosyltransferase family 2 protein n=1 Tax=Alicyclobacillus hesperidum TaxID=89784 RepID=UPI000A42342C|nr:glycosyltransferase family 2 protein [Alicyclobacillus hesperidum]